MILDSLGSFAFLLFRRKRVLQNSSKYFSLSDLIFENRRDFRKENSITDFWDLKVLKIQPHSFLTIILLETIDEDEMIDELRMQYL